MAVPRRPATPGRRRGWLLAAAAAVSLAACGNAVPAGQATPARTGPPAGSASQLRSAGRGTLCASVLDRLTVSRVNSLPGNRPHFSFPATVQVDAAAQAQAVARALCSIPPLRSGDLACPADFGIVYRLDFASAGERLPEVTIRAGGCQTVAGAGLSGSAISSPAFWTVLGTAMGLKGPGHPAFAGTMPS